jgi:hypothetical protein
MARGSRGINAASWKNRLRDTCEKTSSERIRIARSAGDSVETARREILPQGIAKSGNSAAQHWRERRDRGKKKKFFSFVNCITDAWGDSPAH